MVDTPRNENWHNKTSKKINNDFEKKVEKAVKLFEAFDEDFANGVKSNNPEECKESCKAILESDPIEYI
jgi:hypothetical protein